MNNTNSVTYLHEEKIIHPISIFIGLSFYGIIVFLINYLKLGYNFLTFLFIISFIYIADYFKVKYCTCIKGNKIIKGIQLKWVGFIKINDEIALSEIREIKIIQNEKKHFEIVAISKEGNVFVIKSIANKFPAEAELLEIQEKICSVTSKSI